MFFGGAGVQFNQGDPNGAAMVQPGIIMVDEDNLPDDPNQKKDKPNDYLSGENDEQLGVRYANALRAMHRRGTDMAFDPYSGPEGMERARKDSKLMADFVKMNVEEQRAMLVILEAPDGPLNHANAVSDAALEILNSTLTNVYGFEGNLADHDPIIGFSRYLVRKVGDQFPQLIQAGSAASALYACVKSIKQDSNARSQARARNAKRKRDEMDHGRPQPANEANPAGPAGGAGAGQQPSVHRGMDASSNTHFGASTLRSNDGNGQQVPNAYAQQCLVDPDADNTSQAEESDVEE